jgi:hypothetical protein
MNMLWKMVEPKYQANPVLARALDILFILHADHEQNCSTNVMRAVGSSQADPFLATAAAAAALSGPLHGGANEEVLRMLDEIGTKDRVPAYVDSVKAGKVKLMGFGHRVYKNYDPRARIIKWAAGKVFEVTGGIPSWRSLWSWSASRSKTSTSSSASSTRMWTSTPALCIRPWASVRRCSPCCSPFRAPWAGWRNGRRCSRTRAEDRPSAPDLYGLRSPQCRAHGKARRRRGNGLGRNHLLGGRAIVPWGPLWGRLSGGSNRLKPVPPDRPGGPSYLTFQPSTWTAGGFLPASAAL